MKQRLAIDESVTGVVFARAHFGAWVDLGVGFPALLEIICIDGMTPERYQSGDWSPIGSEVTAIPLYESILTVLPSFGVTWRF